MTRITLVETGRRPHRMRRTRTSGRSALIGISLLAVSGGVLAMPSAAIGQSGPGTPRLLVVVAGQSNAIGLGSYAVDPTFGVDFMAPPFANGADVTDTIVWSESQGASRLQTQPVPIGTPQLNAAGSQIFGPEVELARTLQAYTTEPITIVKAAYASTTLQRSWSPTRPNGAFSAMVALVKGAEAADSARGYSDTIGAFYWYQGETDALTPGYGALYQANLADLVAAVRSTLPMPSPAPFVIAKEDVSDVCGLACTGNLEVRAADDWAAATLPDVDEVDTAALARNESTPIHLSDQGEMGLGFLLAAASGDTLAGEAVKVDNG